MTRSLVSIGVGILCAAFLVVPAMAAEDAAEFEPAKLNTDSLRGLTYPATAKVANVGATVRLVLTVDDRGRVSGADVLDCDQPDLGFEDAATEAARRWRFEPARLAAQPVESTTVVQLGFNPRGGGGSSADPGFRASVAVLGGLRQLAGAKGDAAALPTPPGAVRPAAEQREPELYRAEFSGCGQRMGGEPCLYEKGTPGHPQEVSLPAPPRPQPISR